LAFDADSKVACETLVTTGQVILAEVKSNTYLDVQQIARDVIRKIGYTKSEYMFEATCGILQLFTNNLLILTKVLIEQIQKSKVLEIKE
jgi:S-adenosylmethionine synthetase